jgi:exosortase/archaeosortase family protein
MMRGLGWRVARFCLLAGAGMTVTLFLAIDWLRPPLTAMTAKVTAALLSLCGGAAQAQGSMVRSEYGEMQIIYECTGILPAVILMAAVLSFPASWGSRCFGAVLGIVAMQGMNQVRIVSLVILGRLAPGTVETAHHLVWPAVISMSTVFLFAQWAKRSLRLGKT